MPRHCWKLFKCIISLILIALVSPQELDISSFLSVDLFIHKVIKYLLCDMLCFKDSGYINRTDKALVELYFSEEDINKIAVYSRW